MTSPLAAPRLADLFTALRLAAFESHTNKHLGLFHPASVMSALRQSSMRYFYLFYQLTQVVLKETLERVY